MRKETSIKNNSMPDLRSGLRRVTINTGSILASDASNRISMFIINVLVARFLGVREFGQLALALNLFRTFDKLAVGGLKSLVVREVAKNQAQSEKFLVNASFVVSIVSVTSIMLLSIFVWTMKYSDEMSSAIIIMSLGLLPFALSSILDALFQAQEKMQYITYSNVTVNLLRLSGVFILFWYGGSLKQLIYFLVVTHLSSLVIKLWFLLKQINRTGEIIDFKFCISMAKASVTFLSINGLSAVMQSFNIVLLSKLTSEIEVGIYSAANQLMVPISQVFNSIAFSVYPAMCRSYKTGITKLKLISERVLEVLLAVVLPATVALFILADSLFLMLYNNKDFMQSTTVLQIMVWVLIFRASSKVLGIVLVASHKEKKTLQIHLVDLSVMLILGFILVSRYGVLGSALTTLIVGGMNFIQHYMQVSRIFSNFSIRHLFWKPTIAATVMSIVLFSFAELHIFARGVLGSLIYFTALAVILFITIGNLEQLKVRYVTLKTE